MSQSFERMERTQAVRVGQPIPLLGLTFYPILMSHYEEFLSCKDSLTVRLSTLPVKYMTKDYFSALYSMELDSIMKEGKGVGMFGRALKLFFLSLRIEENKLDLSKVIQCETQNGEIVITKINVTQNNTPVSITPFEFSVQVRPLIAQLNGLQLPDESENPDLVIANEQKKALNASDQKLNVTIEDLVSSVAFQSRCRESEIWGWTVREFESRKKAIDRDKRFMMYGQAELSGMVKFKKGNPAPSWCYDVLDDSLGTQSLSELNFGDAKQKNE